jgi:hypothetical protein
VIKAESELEREKTVWFFRESMSNRLNDERSATVVIMQRVHKNDVSGDILAREADYCHMGTSKNSSHQSRTTKLPSNDSVLFPFRFVDVHSRRICDWH